VILAFYFDDIIRIISKLSLRNREENPGDEESTPRYENNVDTSSELFYSSAGDYDLNNTNVGLGKMKNRGPRD
jgi:hypothetical protein